MLGQFRAGAAVTDLEKLTHRFNIKHEFIASSHNELNINSFKDGTEKSEKFMQQYLKTLEK
jgi:hypothetical protein